MERLNKDLQSNPNQPDTDEYDTYIIGLRIDPTDAIYTQELLKKKVEAFQRRANRRKARSNTPKINVTPEAPEALKDPATAIQGQVIANNDMVGRRDEHTERRETPVITGMPPQAMNPEAAFAAEREGFGAAGPTFDPASAEARWMNDFYNENGLYLSPETEKYLPTTGQYVYVGKQNYADTTQQKGYTRPVYLYADDAQALLAGMPSDAIAAYQEQLGLSPTGIIDGDLQGLWDEAVERGLMYAKAGKQVELQFIFDTLVAEVVAKGGLGRGGGGGGGGSAMSETEYYFAMMEVLGDISGVTG